MLSFPPPGVQPVSYVAIISQICAEWKQIKWTMRVLDSKSRRYKLGLGLFYETTISIDNIGNIKKCMSLNFEPIKHFIKNSEKLILFISTSHFQ